MYSKGHYGAASLCYAPVGSVLLVGESVGLVLLGWVLCVSLCRLPDLDVAVPFCTHRGSTHTVWFALLVGILCGVAGWGLHHQLPTVVQAGGTTPRDLGTFTGAVGTLSICSHLVADVITPAGIRPLWPVSSRHFTFDVVPAKDRFANQLLFLAGVCAFLITVVEDPGPF